jgi:prolyl-tRNA synthetase
MCKIIRLDDVVEPFSDKPFSGERAMRWSRTLIPTLKEIPQEAEIPSHRLLLRAGLIRRLAGGLYTFLPLGLRALRKVEAVVREEMDAAGALEVLMPALQPREIWERTGRYETLRDVMFRVRDRQERDLVLGPTHEEVVTDLAAREIRSYRQLPKNFYQIQTKFRDEIRPRFGLMRAKEFLMKDAYSFDRDWESADASYRAMYEAYERIFRRIGLRTKVVEADTGAMGGRSSHEFMVLAEAGEDGIVECDACSYAANLEKAEARVEPAWARDASPIESVATPGQRTIAEVSSFLGLEASRFLKTIIVLADGEPKAALVPGDRDINELKLARALGAADVAMADDATVERVTGAPVGYAGPVGCRLPLVADLRLRGASGAVTGANAADAHLLHVDLDRDAGPIDYADIAMAADGDGCPRCEKGVLRERRGIEVGHVFKLGAKYSEALGATYLDENGVEQTAIMGCYGIGVTRALQSLIEQGHDESGIIWPVAVAPYTVEVLPISLGHPETAAVCESLEQVLEGRGIDVLVDDRDERPGVKFKDADLIGLPLRVTVGDRGLKKGVVECRVRRTGDVVETPVERAADCIQSLLAREAES